MGRRTRSTPDLVVPREQLLEVGLTGEQREWGLAWRARVVEF